jgi:mono/diheme cytochrome c family protein
MRSFTLPFFVASIFVVCLAALATEARIKPEPDRAVRAASQLYRRYCVSCHGTDGRAQTSKGKFSHARDLTDAQWQQDVTDERIFNSIMNGRSVRGNMPAFSNKMNEQEADTLVDFVRRFKG